MHAGGRMVAYFLGSRRLTVILTVILVTLCLTRLLYQPHWMGDFVQPVESSAKSSAGSSAKSSAAAAVKSPVVSLNCPQESVLCGINREDENVQNQLDRSLDALRSDFYKFMTTTTGAALCRDKTITAGGAGFTYDVCIAQKYKPIQHNCIVYNFGVGSVWTFEETMARGQFGCEVHTFYPSPGEKDHVHSPNVTYHNLLLWGSDFDTSNKKMQKLSTVRRSLGHDKRQIDMINVDVEIGEWPFLRNVIYEEPEQLITVGQLVIELHTPTDGTSTFSKEAVIEVLDYFEKLTKDLGFVVYISRMDTWCCANFAAMFPSSAKEKCCAEIYLLNTRYRRYKD